MTLTEHLWQIVGLALLIAGPVPVILTMARYWTALPLAERLAAYLVAWSAIQIVVGQVLGHLGVLRLETVLGIYAGAALAVALLARRGYVRLSTVRWPSALLSLDKWTMILTAMLVAVAIVLVGKLLIYPTTDYDSLNYHLPVMARWYNTQSLVMEKWHREQFFYFPEYYPYGWEILGTLFILPLREDFAVMLPNVLAWVLLGLSVWSILMRLRLSMAYVLAGTALVLTAPVVTNLMFTVHVDLALGAFFLAALALLLAYHETRRIAAGVTAVAALALATGIKTTGLMYAVMLLFASAVVLEWPWAQWIRSRRSIAKLAGIALALGFGAVVIGGGWYLRNWLETGNPLYPIRIALGNLTVFPGLVTSADIARTTLAVMFDVQRADHWNALFSALNSELSWPGLLLLVLGAAGVIVTLLRYRSVARFREKLLIILLSGLTLLLYMHLPFTGDNGSRGWQITPWIGTQMRFAVAFLGMWTIMATCGAETLRIPSKLMVLFSITACGWALYQISGQWLLIGAILAGVGLLLLNRRREMAQQWQRPLIRRSLLVLVGTGVIFGSFALRLEHDEQRRAIYGNTQDWLDEHLTDRDRLGYVLSPSKYLLYGRHLDRKNEFVPLAAAQTQADWLALLRARGITHFAIGPLQTDWLNYPQVKWLEDQRFFDRVLGSDAAHEIVIYRLKPAGTS
jgi:hypothetical protein